VARDHAGERTVSAAIKSAKSASATTRPSNIRTSVESPVIVTNRTAPTRHHTRTWRRSTGERSELPSRRPAYTSPSAGGIQRSREQRAGHAVDDGDQ
jgi:hypothetical protein